MKIKVIDYGYTDLPRQAYNNDAGYDVFSRRSRVLQPNETATIPLGIGLELPDGLAAFVFPRSSWAKKGIVSQIPPIDSTYRGEIHAFITNTTNEKFLITNGMKIAQLIFLPIVLPQLVVEIKGRGINGLGSSGK